MGNQNWSGIHDLYVGFSSLELGDNKVYFPRGIVLEKTYAYVFSTTLAAFNPPPKNGGPHPPPWVAVLNTDDKGADVIAQLYVPSDAAATESEQREVIDTIAMLIRLSADPQAYAQAITSIPFAQIPSARPSSYYIARLAGDTPTIKFYIPDKSRTLQLMQWVTANLETVLTLRANSHEFKFATVVYEKSQYLQETALALIQIWSALEALFLSSTNEITFRISALLAAYLRPPGASRIELQKKCKVLYGKRSKAAHGPSKHAVEDLHESYELLRSVIFKIISEGKVPSKEEFEARLFGN